MSVIKPPFPWFGGKSRVSSIVWQRFGDVKNYVEPFAGSLAVLLNRSDYDPFRHTETVNDLDCFIANFWRATQNDPESVAYWADQPVNEADLSARHQWLVNQEEFREQMKTDPDYFDPKIAGWWVWGLCLWIGSGWCAGADKSRRGHDRDADQGVYQQRPDLVSSRGILSPRVAASDALGNNGRGVHRKLPHLGDNGRGVHRVTQIVDLQANQGVNASPASSFGGQRAGSASQASELYEYFEVLRDRLRRVRVCCGDWERVCTSAVTDRHGLTAVFLDPPYDREIRCSELYSTESDVSTQVREWAIANGNNPKLRIALCGYEGEHEMPSDWDCVAWKAPGGYAAQRRDKTNNNGAKERIWFSPHCVPAHKDEQLLLL